MKSTEELHREFIKLTNRILEIYHQLDGDNVLEREVVAGTDMKGNIIFIFKGTVEEIHIVRNFLYTLKMGEKGVDQ